MYYVYCIVVYHLFVVSLFAFVVLQLIRSTNVLIGIHGAGLMFIMFAAEEVHTVLKLLRVCTRVDC